MVDVAADYFARFGGSDGSLTSRANSSFLNDSYEVAPGASL